jgi:hypothetical protein
MAAPASHALCFKEGQGLAHPSNQPATVGSERTADAAARLVCPGEADDAEEQAARQ